MSNTAIWDALKRTDPKHTKSFKRGGGFSGTAVKPQWVISRLTEEFGPCGIGWGVGEPAFQVVHGDNKEVLVFCTVTAWYRPQEDAADSHPLYGVGGDKVVTYIKANEQYNRPERWENDDEAFKKAFTDAIMNAFKFIGVAADVHMGLFDDSKYVQEAKEAFKAESPSIKPEQVDTLVALMEEVGADRARFLSYLKVQALSDLPATEYDRAVAALEAKRAQ